MQRLLVGLAVLAVLVGFMIPGAAIAEHRIVDNDIFYSNSNWNGIRVFLSSPRHDDSGGKVKSGNDRECKNPGWEENVSGRYWNFWATNTNYYAEQYDSQNKYRNLRSRGYKVGISRNDGRPPKVGATANRNASNNWDADVHLVTHTNSHEDGCPSSPRYLLLMYRPGDGHGVSLRRQVS